MTVQAADSAGTSTARSVDYDAIVVGAGFGGLRMLHELRELGLTAKVIEAGSDVGGTWYWNRYPGARTDSESWAYIVNFSRELKAEWDWRERFPSQPEVLSYLRHVADRFDMRRDIEFNTRVTRADYDESANRWTVHTEGGESYTSTFFIPATGVLSHAQRPPFPGLDRFRGEYYETSRWPHGRVDFTGKRVAVVGTGASGVQVIPIVAHAAEHLTVFQRTPNYVMPARNAPLTDEHRAEIKRNYDQVLEQAFGQVFALPIKAANRTWNDVTEEEFHRILEAGWEWGGFQFVFETFDDLWVEGPANEKASEFVRNKIRAIVKDPATAELLCPPFPMGLKRPPLGHGYFEAFNRDNVDLVSVKDNPIVEVTETGLRLADGTEYEVDAIIFALGFDAGTGAILAMDIRGEGGVSIAEKWAGGPTTYLGLAVDSFPNMFIIDGPQGAFGNVPLIIDKEVEWIGRALRYLREHGYDRMVTTEAACKQWHDECAAVMAASIISRCGEAGSWWIGANIPGKPIGVLFYLGSCAMYFDRIAGVADADFEGFTFDRVGVPA
jgi:cyclohexanone monooxygenase